MKLSSSSLPSAPANFLRMRCPRTEIVLGQEQPLIDEVAQALHFSSVLLDLSNVARVDAAGISALLCLYRLAQNTGHRFFIASPSRHVKEFLVLVGLEKLLTSRIARKSPQSGPFRTSALV